MSRRDLERKQMEDSSDISETKCQTICRYIIKGLKRFITFLFSHVGLSCLIVGYSLLGGIMFKAIELPNEKEIRKRACDTVDLYKEVIVEYTDTGDENAVALYRSLWDKKLFSILRGFELDMNTLIRDYDWDGQLGDEPYQWTFANSLLYSVTIITTIGYGNVTPKTDGGRLVSIIYASIGIPLTMLWLRNIGDMLAGFFRIGYRLSCTNMTYQYIKLKRRRVKKRFLKRLRNKTKEIKHWAHSKQSLVSNMIHRQMSTRSKDSKDYIEESEARIIPSIEEVSSDEDESFELKTRNKSETVEDSKVYGRQRSLSLHCNKRNSLERLDLHRKMSVCSSGQMVQTFDRVISPVYDLSIIPEDSVEIDLQSPVSPKTNEEGRRPSSTISDLSIHDFEEDDLRLKERLKSTRDFVPISVCLLLVTGYIIGGAILFTSWEQDWDFLIGFYFCFITLSTIGFGDFVPGMVNTNWDSDGRRVICIMYLVVGMALLAMSFHLIQEEVRHKFRKLAIKIGLIEERLTKMLDKYNY